MITLSEDFISRVNSKDTRKLTVAHLYYDDTHFMAVSTVATVIDGIQYLGVLKDMGGASHKWNLTGNNSVTISTPKLTIIDYNTPDGFSIITEFNTHVFYGRKIAIYYGYEGQTLADMLKAFDGVIDEINYDGGEIEITAKNFTIPNTNINGRKINYDTQKIGDVSIPNGYKIDKSNHNKTLPIPFGNHWCAPLQNGFSNDTTKESSYCIYDENYSTLLANINYIKDNIYQFNIGKVCPQILLHNDDAYTPLHSQGWGGDNELTYTIRFNSAVYLNGITIAGTDSGTHRRTDDKFFITVPLRYQVRTDLANWFVIEGQSDYDTDTTILKVFDNTDSTPFTIVNNNTSWLRLWVKLTLDEKKNLRGDEKSFIRSNRKIHIPSVSNNNNGQGYLLGKYNINIGTLGWFHDDIWVAVDEFPIRINHWKNGFIPNEAFVGGDDNRFIGAGDLGRLTPTTTKTYPYIASFGARVFNKYSANNYNYDIFDEDNYLIGFQGSNGGLLYTGADSSYGLLPKMGNDPMILRETLTEPLGAALEFYMAAPKNYNNTGFGDNTVKLYKAFHLTAGEIDLNQSARVYAASNGVQLINSNSLKSTPQVTNGYTMQRPYEYIEFLLKDKTTNTGFSADYNNANISAKWNTFFSTSRDGSGFVIDKELTLDKFISEYIQSEPFTIYTAEDGTFQLKMFQKSYVDGDTLGFLDYNDATNFNISLTPYKNIVSEIKSLKTDLMYDLDSYVLDVNWRLKSTSYDYGFWKYGNTVDNNEFKIDIIEKKYTSYVPVDICIYGGKHWGCVRTNTNNIPSSDSLYWKELNEPIATNAWSSSTKYFGEDAEQFEIASWFLNQWANRHRVISYETDNMLYLKYNVGDIVEFSNVPFTLAGIDIKGFNGATNFSSTINGQTVYASFIITNIQKSLKSVKIEAMQLHNLNQYEIERVN